ncbi:MAG: hypothetical protein ACE5IK_00135 [Acidobacteriota bacterium]
MPGVRSRHRLRRQVDEVVVDPSPMEDWQQRRSRFNHDWLKNRYLNRLDGFLALLAVPSSDPERLLEFVRDDFPAWEARSRQAGDLIWSFVQEMSPRCFVTQAPLCLLARTTRHWLGTLLHDLWAARYPISERVDAAAQALIEADEAYWRIKERLAAEPADDVSRLRQLAHRFENLRRGCHHLGDSLSRMPHEILIV